MDYPNIDHVCDKCIYLYTNVDIIDKYIYEKPITCPSCGSLRDTHYRIAFIDLYETYDRIKALQEYLNLFYNTKVEGKYIVAMPWKGPLVEITRRGTKIIGPGHKFVPYYSQGVKS